MATPALFGNVDPNEQAAAQNRQRQALAKALLGGAGGQGGAFDPLQHPMQALSKLGQAGLGAYQQNRRQNALMGPMAQLGAPKGLY